MKKTLLSLLTLGYLGYWLVINLGNYDPESTFVTVFSSTFIVVALLGGIFGLTQAKQWGGFKSLLGKTISFLSLGLILTTLGSLVLSFYFYILESEPSYPSVAEVFYFSGILSYIVGTVFLAKTIRSWKTLKNKPLLQKLTLVLLPLIMVGLTFLIFVDKHGNIEGLSSGVVITDFAYAISQAIYAIIALAVLLNSSQLFGGVLRKAVMLLLIGLLVQYAADFNYSYQLISETWVNGGYGELLYLLAYAIIGVSIQMFTLPKTKAVEKEAA